jgi:putative membrane protein
MLQLLLGVPAGILLGTATIIPGLHINLLSAMLIANASTLNPEFAAITIFIMAITATFMDFIPSTFLGAPESETAMSVLPAHRMLLKGRAFDAIFLTTIGNVFGICCAAALFPLALLIYPAIFMPANKIMHGLLILAISFFILREDSWRKRAFALAIVIFSGTLGLLALSKLDEPLLPMFSGLFGLSTIISSMGSRTSMPKQHIGKVKLPLPWLKNSVVGVIFGSIINIFPAIGPAQAATAASIFAGGSKRSYLLTISALNTAAMALSLSTLYSINRGRNGAIEALSSFAKLDVGVLAMLLGAALLALPLIVFLKIQIAKVAAKIVAKLPYKLICICTISIIVAIVTIMSGSKGLVVLATGTAIGLAAITTGTSRSHSMACLIVPVIIQRI